MLSGEELESERRHKDLAELVGHRHSDRDVQFGTYLNINDREYVIQAGQGLVILLLSFSPPGIRSMHNQTQVYF